MLRFFRPAQAMAGSDKAAATPLRAFFRVFEAFGASGWDKRLLSRAGPPMAACTHGELALALLACPTLFHYFAALSRHDVTGSRLRLVAIFRYE
jgi:hypothetical protein